MRVLITGATGLVGKKIVKLCLKDGIAVNYLTTSKSKLKSQDNYKGFYWNPVAGEIDKSCFEDVDAIINLVGASISKRWTDTYKKEILESRTLTAKLLKKSIEDNSFNIKQIVSASAIGIYPSSLVNYYEEDFDTVSDTFLGEVVEKWEEAVDGFKSSGLDVCKIRIGLVLSENGGALPEIIKPIKFGAGAAFGSGEQWQSWIHVTDLAHLFLYAVKHGLTGVYNAVAPNPVSNTELTKSSAKVLSKPLILPNIPKFAMKLALGEMHILLFESQRVSSSKIEQEGFEFTFPNLEPALQDLLN
ncbi:TIGR01777 family protein [Winogradskyella sp. PC-19]|uniref:TIGR01777 family oxidoreductase n=1 Tax=unclassified Winogradskyella TaxID=2615021 RepID=UPI000B3C6CEC|nr:MULTISPECIES: TIGR01777 family oxidoreductase [unclassified Winogradskyella]ARV09042.1 TIGR01777 family protein [Winogradskyella sp. PC-19]RZN77638.1 MAG: TIGR01777 family protein [Winogradskyella sp.]